MTIADAGKGYKTVKGFMAEAVLSRLCAQSSQPLALFVADDKNDCLIDFEEAAKRTRNASGHRIDVTTFNIPRNWHNSQAHNYEEEMAYFRRDIELSDDIDKLLDKSISQIQTGWSFNKESAQNTILQHMLHHGRSDQWITLASMAERGTGLYKNNQSVSDAYQLLCIAMLRAQGQQNYLQAMQQLTRFMQAHDMAQLFKLSTSEIAIATIQGDIDLNQNQATELKSLTAHQLLSYMKRQALNPNNKTFHGQLLRHRLACQYRIRIDALTAKIDQTDNKAIIDKLKHEIKSTQYSIKRLQAASAEIDATPLAWENGTTNTLEKAEVSEQAIAASSSSSSQVITSVANHPSTLFGPESEQAAVVPSNGMTTQVL